MKTFVLTFALLGSVALGAAPTVEPEPTPATAAPAGIPEAVAGAIDQAGVIAQNAMKQAGRTLRLTQNRLIDTDGAPMDLMDGESFSMAFSSPSRAGTQPLIVRTSELHGETVANLQEDLSVMSRILNKAVEHELGREGKDSAMGIVLSTLPGSRRPESIYLEGYGALFFISVKFPLVPSPAKEEEKAEKQADTTWEQTKREMYGQRNGNVKVWSVPGPEAVEYDAEQVDNLKKELLESLKNGSNIRDVKPDESLTIAVLGNRASSMGGGGGAIVRKKNLGGNVRRNEAHVGGGGAGMVTAGGDTLRPRGRESTMTIRVKKADAEAYAKGSIDFDEFKKRAAVTTY